MTLSSMIILATVEMRTSYKANKLRNCGGVIDVSTRPVSQAHPPMNPFQVQWADELSYYLILIVVQYEYTLFKRPSLFRVESGVLLWRSRKCISA